MILLALLFILAAAALALFMIFGVSHNSVGVKIDGLGLSLNSSPLTIYILGAATMLLLALGWGLLRHGSRRKLESRRELKRLRKAEREQDRTAQASTGTGRLNDARGTHDRGVAGADPADAPAGRRGADEVDLRDAGGTYLEDDRRR